MFTALLSWFAGARTWLDWLLREIWRQVERIFTSVWGWGLITVGWIYTGAKWIGDSIGELAASIDAIQFPEISHGSGPMSEGLAFANTILPLEELLGFVVAYITLRLGLTVYKLIKSWIPTLS